jgi:hypothetical protein
VAYIHNRNDINVYPETSRIAERYRMISAGLKGAKSVPCAGSLSASKILITKICWLLWPMRGHYGGIKCICLLSTSDLL